MGMIIGCFLRPAAAYAPKREPDLHAIRNTVAVCGTFLLQMLPKQIIKKFNNRVCDAKLLRSYQNFRPETFPNTVIMAGIILY